MPKYGKSTRNLIVRPKSSRYFDQVKCVKDEEGKVLFQGNKVKDR